MANRTRKLTLVLGMTLLLSASHVVAEDSEGSYWQSLSPHEREVFVMSFKAGLNEGHVRTMLFLIDHDYLKQLSKEAKKKLREEVTLNGSRGALSDAISALYQDPSNTYVMNSDAVIIASERLAGKDVEAELRRARKDGLKIHEQTEKKDRQQWIFGDSEPTRRSAR
jgi:hypothetical protein